MNFITILQVLGLDASLNRLTNPLGIFGDVFKSYSVQILSSQGGRQFFLQKLRLCAVSAAGNFSRSTSNF